MFVHVLKEKSVRIDKINSRTFPAGWKGDVAVDALADWSEGEDFVFVDVPGEIAAKGGKPSDVLTTEEVQVLKTAAGQALAHAQGLIADELAGDEAKSEGDEA